LHSKFRLAIIGVNSTGIFCNYCH